MTDKIVVFCTCQTMDEAVSLGRHVVEKRLAACANILPGVRSIYRWEGKVEDSAEVLLVIKSRRDRFDELRSELERIHSYSVPEVIALPIAAGADRYLEWIDREVS